MLYDHQKQILKRNPKKHGLFWPTGTGKTLALIKLAEKNAKNILIVCPKSIKENWSREITKWASDNKQQWKVITKEEFRRDWETLSLESWDGLIIDEAHSLCGYKSQLFKNAQKYLKKAELNCIYVATATPYTSTPFSVYCLEILLGRYANWREYRYKYFDDVWMGSRSIPKVRQDARFALAKIINKIGSVIKREECLDLPDKIYLKEYFKLSTEQKKAIKSLKQNPLSSSHIAYWTAMHRIGGGTYKNDMGDVEYLKNEKLKRLIELAKEHKKLVVFSRYNAELDMIKKELEKEKIQAKIINGKTENRQELFDWGNKSKEAVLLIQSAICEGFELTHFNITVFYSNDFSLKNRIQGEGRTNRTSSINEKSVYIDFIVDNDVDEGVIKCIENKMDFHIEMFKPEKYG